MRSVAYSERCLFPEPFLAALRDRKTGDQLLVATMRYNDKKTAEVWVFASIADFQSRCRGCTTAGSRSGGASRRHVGRSAARRSLIQSCSPSSPLSAARAPIASPILPTFRPTCHAIPWKRTFPIARHPWWRCGWATSSM